MTDGDQYVLGVDPGSAHVGICVRTLRTGSLVEAAVLDRTTEDLIEWCLQVANRVAEIVVAHEAPRFDAVGVEETRRPNPHLGLSNPQAIIDTAWVAGAVATTLAAATRLAPVIVPVSRHGSGPRGAYPEQLWGPREKQGTGRLRHARSAFDIAGVASGRLVP